MWREALPVTKTLNRSSPKPVASVHCPDLIIFQKINQHRSTAGAAGMQGRVRRGARGLNWLSRYFEHQGTPRGIRAKGNFAPRVYCDLKTAPSPRGNAVSRSRPGRRAFGGFARYCPATNERRMARGNGEACAEAARPLGARLGPWLSADGQPALPKRPPIVLRGEAAYGRARSRRRVGAAVYELCEYEVNVQCV